MQIETVKADLTLTQRIIASITREVAATRKAAAAKIKDLERQLKLAQRVKAALSKKRKPVAPAAVDITDPTGNVEIQNGSIVVRANDNHTPSTEVQGIRAWVGPASGEPEFMPEGGWLVRDEGTPQLWYGFVSTQGDPQTGEKLVKVWTQHLTVPDTDVQTCTVVNP